MKWADIESALTIFIRLSELGRGRRPRRPLLHFNKAVERIIPYPLSVRQGVP